MNSRHRDECTLSDRRGTVLNRFSHDVAKSSERLRLEGLAAEAAFGLLARTSQSQNRKLREVADEVVVTGQIPTPRVNGTRQTLV